MSEARATERATDRIRVTGITATGHHGVFEHERRDGQTFVADVVLHVDTRPAAAADRLDLTADYGVLAEQVAGVLSGTPADLIETVAERIAAVALTHHGVLAVDVTVHKPQAPVTVPVGDVTVEIHRDLVRMPVVTAPVVAPAAAAPVVAGPGRLVADGRPATVENLLPAMAASVLAAPSLPVPAPGEPAVPALVTAPGPAGSASTGTVAAAAGPSTAPTVTEPRDRLDLRPDQPVDVVLAIGSNVGASHETLRQTVLDLGAVLGLEVTAVAPLARTGAVGGPEQPDYLNTIVLARTSLSPRALLHACQRIELDHGREREVRWGPRTVDIDLITYGTLQAVADDLELPHPRAHQRAFVLEPWAQVDPLAELPGLGGGPVAALAQTAPDREGIRWMALDWWGPTGAGA
ncbi:2-amino-4-hydroxy-6-hydroxymethyldihydropteridine diphosphokinase [Cellulomonas sp. KRMCY2]|uniref:2-amino-4-hydroxy-6- hydroxymethyldihydropteridine diphosphokinase n=1 Tax=Cellulomonas sp. KRMCY2 TaxID=1304865 RepID=UPI00045EAC59|nr:2-amino-4-hydroxy-6-hydroxymethyldihydropteridine diphosphokinase [Cellulomonas sp. KRMCY2]